MTPTETFLIIGTIILITEQTVYLCMMFPVWTAMGRAWIRLAEKLHVNVEVGRFTKWWLLRDA